MRCNIRYGRMKKKRQDFHMYVRVMLAKNSSNLSFRTTRRCISYVVISGINNLFMISFQAWQVAVSLY